MVDIKFAEKQDICDIVKLSREFANEQCCNGIKADDGKYFDSKKVVIAKIESEIVGYCYGEVEMKTKATSFFEKGSKSFYLEEIYISPKFRKKGIGKLLFEFIENYAKSLKCEILETTAVSKDYKKLLKFYIERNNMQFWSANIIKKL